MQTYQTKYKVEAIGLNLHKLLSYLEQKNINLENIERPTNKTLIFVISKQDYQNLKKQSLFQDYKFKILNKKSLTNVFKFTIKNLGLLLGLLFSLFTIFSISNYVYSIDFNTENHVCSNSENCIFAEHNKTLLTDYLKSIGITQNMKISELPSPKDVESSLVKNFDQISGAKVYLTGTKLHIDIVEAKLNQTSAHTCIIAPHNGIVISTKVINGNLKVKNGDTVLKGQTLVEKVGDLPISAEIILRSFYHDSTIFDEQQITYEQTGNKLFTNNISCFGIEIKDNKLCPFNLYKSYTSKKYASLNMLLPIEITTTTYVELKRKETFIEYSSQENNIKEKLSNSILAQLPTYAEQKNITFTTFREGTRVRTDCYIEVLLTISA